MAVYEVSPKVQPRNQPNGSTCWLSCLEMLFEWKKKDPSTICDLIDQNTELFSSQLCKYGIAPEECKVVAKALGLQWTGGGDIGRDTLYQALKSRGPYWIGGQWYLHRSHAIVLTAADPNSDNIRYINPFNNFSLTDSPGTLGWLNDNRGEAWKQSDSGLMYWL
jgi:hypothetical protein